MTVYRSVALKRSRAERTFTRMPDFTFARRLERVHDVLDRGLSERTSEDREARVLADSVCLRTSRGPHRIENSECGAGTLCGDTSRGNFERQLQL
jgi:hypothetical protein